MHHEPPPAKRGRVPTYTDAWAYDPVGITSAPPLRPKFSIPPRIVCCVPAAAHGFALISVGVPLTENRDYAAFVPEQAIIARFPADLA